MSTPNASARSFDKLVIGNWPSFQRNMYAALRSRGVWGIVTGKCTRPADPVSGADNFAAQQERQEEFDIDAEKAAGDIMLMLSPDEQSFAQDYADDPMKLWDALEERHVQKRVNARFNAYDEFFSIALQEGETLAHLAERVKAAMRRIQERRPAKDFTLEHLDNELQVMATVRALSGDVSCRTLVTSLMHASDLEDLDALNDKLVTEDLQSVESAVSERRAHTLQHSE